MARKTKPSASKSKRSASRARKSAKKTGSKKTGSKNTVRASSKPSARPSAKPPAARSQKSPAAGSTGPLRDFCRSLPGTTEDIKWEDHLMFCVGEKIYAGFDVDEASDSFGFKCDDDDFNRLTALGERTEDSIIPAPYAARFGWVKVMRLSALPDDELRGLLRKSYDLVAAKLPKRLKPAAGK